jgi:DNA polymerase-3 subunit gamma/tau
MLTNQAFNALLKTLEEPPEHVKFIFCTTEADKIPITVLSRCQRFDFAPIEMKSIVERLAHICQNEGVAAEPDALHIIARRAAGSMRDSQSLLEQLLSFGGDKITVGDVHSLLGTAHSSRLSSIANCIAGRDAAAALKEVETAVNEGVDLGALTEQLLGYFRDCLAALVGCQPDLLMHVSTADYQSVKTMGQQIGLETLLAMAQILDQTLTRLRQSTHVRTLVELALVRLCKLDDLDALPTLVAELRGQEPVVRSQRITESEARTAQAGIPEQPAPPPPIQKKTPEVDESSPPALLSRPAQQVPLDQPSATSAWQQTLAELGDMTSDFAGRAERIAISGPNRLAVYFGKAYTQAQQYCERPDKRQRLEQTFSRLAGQNVRIDFVMLPDEPAEALPTERPAAKPPVNRRQRQQEVMRNPLIRKASELFDTEIIAMLDPPTDEGERET